MGSFRNSGLQRTFSALLLLVALLSQVQILFACDSLQGAPSVVCCCGEHDTAGCPMGEHCGMTDQAQVSACCELSYDTLNDAGMASSSSTADCLVLLLDGSQPPPAIDHQRFSVTLLQRPSWSFLIALTDPPLSGSGNQTYLYTRRLRI